jgi:hypothetical protein
MGSECVFGFDHDGHAEGDHVYVDIFVAHGVHLQEMVRFCLSVFYFVDVV